MSAQISPRDASAASWSQKVLGAVRNMVYTPKMCFIGRELKFQVGKGICILVGSPGDPGIEPSALFLPCAFTLYTHLVLLLHFS